MTTSIPSYVNRSLEQQAAVEESVFKTSLPYAIATLAPYVIATLATATLGAIVAASAATKALLIVGILFAAVGTYAFIGVIFTSLMANDSSEFKEIVWKGILCSPVLAIVFLVQSCFSQT